MLDGVLHWVVLLLSHNHFFLSCIGVTFNLCSGVLKSQLNLVSRGLEKSIQCFDVLLWPHRSQIFCLYLYGVNVKYVLSDLGSIRVWSIITIEMIYIFHVFFQIFIGEIILKRWSRIPCSLLHPSLDVPDSIYVDVENFCAFSFHCFFGSVTGQNSKGKSSWYKPNNLHAK